MSEYEKLLNKLGLDQENEDNPIIENIKEPADKDLKATASESKESNLNQESEEKEEKPEELPDKKKFSQKEFEKVLKDRLDRAAKKHDKDLKAAIESLENSLTHDVKLRENELTCKEYLLDNKYPVEVLDIIDTRDPEEFKNRVEKLTKMNYENQPILPLASTEPCDFMGDIRRGFSNSKYSPKKY